MNTKPIRIDGVLSKITLAKDQSSTVHATSEMKKPPTAKAKPTGSASEKVKQ